MTKLEISTAIYAPSYEVYLPIKAASAPQIMPCATRPSFDFGTVEYSAAQNTLTNITAEFTSIICTVFIALPSGAVRNVITAKVDSITIGVIAERTRRITRYRKAAASMMTDTSPIAPSVLPSR